MLKLELQYDSLDRGFLVVSSPNYFCKRSTCTVKNLKAHSKSFQAMAKTAIIYLTFFLRRSSYPRLTVLDQNPQTVMPTLNFYSNILRQTEVLLHFFINNYIHLGVCFRL